MEYWKLKYLDADRRQLDASKATGADTVEIHTGHYADAATAAQQEAEFSRIVDGIKYAASLGLRVNVGHGMNYTNTQRLVPIPEIQEYSIGHSIVARALMVGMESAVREMIILLDGA